MEKLIEISKCVYLPCVDVKYIEQQEKSVVVDGETYTKSWNEHRIFNSEKEFINKESNPYWNLFMFDFSDFNHKNIGVWDYSGFTYSSSLLDKICSNYEGSTLMNTRLYRLFHYVFLDYKNPKTRVVKYKTVPDKIYTVYSPLKKTIFNKKKICNIDTGYREDVLENQHYHTFGKNCIRLRHKTETGLIISIPIRYFLTLNIFEMDEYYKQQIKSFYIKNGIYCHDKKIAFDFPNFILKRKITDVEKNNIIANFLIKKSNYKQFKNN
jgi:hypothetical protein